MTRSRTPGRVVTGLVAVVLMLFIGAAAWAVVDDYLQRGFLPRGATITGVPVGGLTRAEATRVIDEQVKGPLFAPITVTFRDAPTTVDPSGMMTVDIDAVLADVASPKLAASLPQRVLWRVTGASYGHDTSDILKVDTTAVQEWVAAEKKRVGIPAVDATVSVTGSKLTIKPAQAGITFNTAAASTALSAALLSGTKTVGLVETTTTPAVTNAKLGKTIFVSRSRKTLVLYNGTKIEKTYRCAVGMPQYPTPLGWWKIVAKQKNPIWRNNGSDWAKSMPAFIPGGPNGPLGTRALYLNASGIRIHGIPPSEDWSVGNAASHGCMRMHRWDVEDLYPRVPIGTRVIIVS
jgi:lipoprotein-anchoring transpeptidase ErfK/SrfK